MLRSVLFCRVAGTAGQRPVSVGTRSIMVLPRAFCGGGIQAVLVFHEALHVTGIRMGVARQRNVLLPGEDILHPKPGLTAIAGSACFVQECASKQEMEEFIASHNPDEAVGDIARRVTTRYVDDPLELILEKNYF